MQFKIEEADIFIYDKMEPYQTNQILLGKVELLKKNSVFSSKLAALQENEGKLWLIRESRVEGLLTVQSVSYEKSLSEWKVDKAQRYLLSNDKGWICNSESPDSDMFHAITASVGGIIKITAENTAPHLPGLLNLLMENGYLTENRINPKLGEETKTKGYTHYTSFPQIPPQASSHLQSTIISLPEGMLLALSCPLSAKKTGEARLMKDPVTLIHDGITYECADLLEKYPHLQQDRDYYPNIKLRAIINYVASNSLQPDEYLEKLKKVEEDILDPIHSVVMENPVLSPSGHSYEKSSIEQWIQSKQSHLSIWSDTQAIPDPITRVDIRGKALVPNVNLRLFIKAWPGFYEEQQQTLLARTAQPS